MNDLSSMRQTYDQPPMDIESLDDCPFRQFEQWFVQATNRLSEPNAMVLATVGPNGQPTLRSVLLKSYDESGFVFFTNFKSRKAVHISENDKVSLLFPWYACQRQIEINGTAKRISNAESLKYFALRPRGSKLGAWVSHQSSVVSSRSLLMTRMKEIREKFAKGEIPKPSSWGGYRVVPNRFEFWQGGQDRIHDRIQYTRDTSTHGIWSRNRLAP